MTTNENHVRTVAALNDTPSCVKAAALRGYFGKSINRRTIQRAIKAAHANGQNFVVLNNTKVVW